MTLSSTMPPKAFLQTQIDQEFLLSDEAGNSISVILKSVDEGVPMDETYTCYSMMIICPPGVQAGQGTYQLSQGENSWLIFMSPTNPDKSGQQRLQASFHFPSEQALA